MKTYYGPMMRYTIEAYNDVLAWVLTADTALRFCPKGYVVRDTLTGDVVAK